MNIPPEEPTQAYISYNDKTDEELITASRSGDKAAEEFLYINYKNFIRGRARSYFLVGADREDIIQEGMIGLYKAIRDYNPEAGPFRNFAELCVTRQIITAIKAATRQKHIPLNSYVSFQKPLRAEEPERTVVDILSAAKADDPEELFISQEAYLLLEERLGSALSLLEKQTLTLYLEGCSYVEIAKLLKKQPKAIDNALQRVKRKLEKELL